MMETITLNNGVKMPLLGYGVYLVDPSVTERCVLDALSVGYRSLDTAQYYENEAMVGSAVHKSGVPRDEIFITSKLCLSRATYARAKENVKGSLKRMGLDYLDLMLIHWPMGNDGEIWQDIKQKIADLNYGNVIGIIYEYDPRRKKEWRSFYPMLLWMAVEEQDNTIRFTSPYLNMLLYKVMKESIRTDRNGLEQHKKNGQLLFEAHHSYLVKTSIAKERNKRAAEIVRIVCVLIEEAGSNTPHISAQTILNRHAELAQALAAMNDVSNQNRLLRTTFQKAWELLRTQTRLEEVYKGIKFPSKADYPTMATLDKSFNFPHQGKKKQNEVD